ncbi:uncharacterized protein LOC126456196 [Schistocerca serialis cubense]|uniref:uncharacterized protein LOC126456196 n=1 Tax=Schistocerca serialis cubense TaxID=2023355 RepID=UPI00214E73C6|nr:uncharacterized protein LOC126456196 [Schistocerca serialis cubense]
MTSAGGVAPPADCLRACVGVRMTSHPPALSGRTSGSSVPGRAAGSQQLTGWILHLQRLQPARPTDTLTGSGGVGTGRHMVQHPGRKSRWSRIKGNVWRSSLRSRMAVWGSRDGLTVGLRSFNAGFQLRCHVQQKRHVSLQPCNTTILTCVKQARSGAVIAESDQLQGWVIDVAQGCVKKTEQYRTDLHPR